jgi:vitamin B12 transporter
MLQKIITATILFLGSIGLAAQPLSISGTVSDQGGVPVIGANIFLEGTYDGTSTDLEGQFSFDTEERGKWMLRVSYIGYQEFEQEVAIGEEGLVLNIVLEEVANELNEVVITAGAFEASDRKKSVVLKPLDIVLTAGATADLAGALNTLPGTQTVGEEGRLFVRGGAAYETKTFIDGLLVLKPYNSSVPDLPARNRFSPFLFKGTLFSTGGYSAEYGQALSSALVLETQDLAPETVTSLSLMSIGLGLSHTERWENSSLTVGGDYTNLSPYMSLIDQNINWHMAPQGINGQLVYRKKTSETGFFKLMANTSQNQLALDYPRAEDLALTRLDLHNHNVFLNTSYQEILGERWSFFAGAAFTEDVDEISESFLLKNKERSYQVKNRWTYTADNGFSLKMGGEFWRQEFSQSYQEADGFLWNPFLENNYLAGFAEANIKISDRLLSRGGLRMEYSSILKESRLSPRWSIAYKTGDHSQFSFAYGSFFQTPENEPLAVSTNLEFEQSTHFILNFQKIHNDRIFRIEAYEKNYDQLIRMNGRNSLPNNGGYGYARGVDVFFRDRKTFKNVDYWVSYSFLDTERLFRDFPEQSRPGFASAHNLSVVYKQWLPKMNTMIGWTYSFGSPRPFNDPNKTVFNAERTPAYHDLSLNGSYLTNWFGHFTIVYVSVSNVLGLDQNFGRRFGTQPGLDGQFASMPVDPAARRFLFLGIFLSLGQEQSF